jgi:hypothetical protein
MNEPVIRIFVDADACPVKEEVYRIAERHALRVYVVANSPIQVPRDGMVRLRSSGSCSTQPGRGKCWGNSCWEMDAMVQSTRNTMARQEVVPWSMASTCLLIGTPARC